MYEVKASGLQLSFNFFWWSSTWHTLKPNSNKLYIIDPEICSILIWVYPDWMQWVCESKAVLYSSVDVCTVFILATHRFLKRSPVKFVYMAFFRKQFTKICITKVSNSFNLQLYQVVLNFCYLIVFCFVLCPRLSLFEKYVKLDI